MDFRELLLRFCFGGTAVAACYIISVYSPVKFLGGVFAAFPAVMAAAVMMAGLRDGKKEAADVARGAVSGMIGCTGCVIAALYFIRVLNSWPLGLAISILVWLVVALASNKFLSAKVSNLVKQADGEQL